VLNGLIHLCPVQKDFSRLENISHQTYAKSLQKLPGLAKNCAVYSQIVQVRQ